MKHEPNVNALIERAERALKDVDAAWLERQRAVRRAQALARRRDRPGALGPETLALRPAR